MHTNRFLAYAIAHLAPPTVRITIRTHLAAKPALVDRHHPAMRAAVIAYRRGFGATPVFLRSGGTIPVVNTLQEMLGIPTVLMGFALPDNRMHAPNEKFHLANFYNGIATCIWLLAAVGAERGLTAGLPVEGAGDNDGYGVSARPGGLVRDY